MGTRHSRKILNGQATLYSPTDAKNWRVAFYDPVTRKRRVLSATSKETAEDKARKALNIWAEDQEFQQIAPPTVRQAFEQWIDNKSSLWVARTVEVYRYRYQGALSHLDQIPVTSIRPRDLKDVGMQLSRDQAKRLRTVVRGIFDTVEGWTHRPGSVYSDAIRLPGTKSDDAPRQVEKVQVPSTAWVNGVINCAYSTCQVHPALSAGYEEIDLQTGHHRRTADLGSLAEDPWFSTMKLLDGAPSSLIDSMRRGVPQHYKEKSQRRENETMELASRFRQIALITALGAAGALRIGEVLALRPRHLFSPWSENQARLIDTGMHTFLTRELLEPGFEPKGSETLGGRLLPDYTGSVHVQEQVSPLSSGRMAVTAPKMGKERTVHLSPLLYPDGDTSRRSIRQLLADPAMRERHNFNFEVFHPENQDQSLWSMTELDAMQLWQAGFVPVTYLLHDRLRELWKQCDGNIKIWWDALLFPTRNKARNRGQGVLYPTRWPYSVDIPFGTYQSPSNITTRYISPLYDYVSDVIGNFPGYRGTSRRGWTHHSLRHWAISQWLSHGVPLPQVADQAGHVKKDFTLSRYAWAIQDNVTFRGFEP